METNEEWFSIGIVPITAKFKVQFLGVAISSPFFALSILPQISWILPRADGVGNVTLGSLVAPKGSLPGELCWQALEFMGNWFYTACTYQGKMHPGLILFFDRRLAA